MLVINQKNNESLYNIYVSNNFNNFYNIFEAYITKENKIFIVTDDKVASLYTSLISDLKDKYCCHEFIINNGEENKNYNTISEIFKFLIDSNADRNSLIISIGGGVVGDIVGFVAATFMRGIKYINIPTTLISQVDSSVGGKVGYNFLNLKNSIGCFYDPVFVYAATDFLHTLNKDQILNGMGEVIKYGLIENNNLFEFIENNVENIFNLKNEVVLHIVYSCLDIKTKVVRDDYNDKNTRNILNFGHTVGHGLETSSEYKLYHGFAVALGMLVAIKLSEKVLGLPKSVYTRLENIYNKLGIPCKYKVDIYNSFLYAIEHDKKNSNNINFVLLKDVGHCEIKVNINKEDLIWALENSICKEVKVLNGL
jgi:3-dehydroquinate synthase